MSYGYTMRYFSAIRRMKTDTYYNIDKPWNRNTKWEKLP